MNFRFAAFIVFVGSFCFMVIEIVGGRMIAPHLGSSLYSWTSVIGVFLGGITLGNALGGVVADRHASRTLLGKVFFLSAITTAFIPFLGTEFGAFLSKSTFPLPLATLLYALVTFFPASFFLSFISPIAIKLVLDNLATTGRVVGRIYAASAFGSIIGTFAAGFFFIAYLGTARIVWIMTLLLFLLSMQLFLNALWRGKRGVIAGLFLAGIIFTPSHCTEETQYYCMRIHDLRDEGRQGFTLSLDHLVHSYVFPTDPTHLKYEYEKASAWFLAYAARAKEPLSILVLGGGGYTLPRYLASQYPEHRVTVVEIDPAVTEANYTRLGLPRTTPIVSVHMDARRYLDSLPPTAQYDIIIGDAFNDFSIPFHLTTREFATRVVEHLKSNGIYLANTIDDPRVGRFLPSMLATFRSVFPFTYFAPLQNEWEHAQRSTFLIAGTGAPIDPDLFASSVPRGREGVYEKERGVLTTLLSGTSLDAFIAKRRGIVLTDDYAPVDNFLAAVFRRSR